MSRPPLAQASNNVELPHWFDEELCNYQLTEVEMCNLLVRLLMKYKDRHANRIILDQEIVSAFDDTISAIAPEFKEPLSAQSAVTGKDKFVQVPIFHDAKQVRQWIEKFDKTVDRETTLPIYYGVFHLDALHWVPYVIYYLGRAPKSYTMESGYPPESGKNIAKLHSLFKSAYMGKEGFVICDIKAVQQLNQRNCGIMSANMLETIISKHGTDTTILFKPEGKKHIQFTLL